MAWIDVARSVVPFTYEPEPELEEPPPPPRPWWTRVSGRTRIVAASGAVTAVAAIVLVTSIGSTPVQLSAGRAVGPARKPAVAVSGSSGDPLSTSSSSGTSTSSTTPSSATSTSPTTLPTATGTDPIAGTGQTPAKVAIIGDSITELSEPADRRVLRQFDPYIEAVGGTTISQHLATIEQLVADGQPRDWIIELGTNDALGSNPNWSSDFATEVSALQGQACVVFVTVNPRLGPVATALDQAIDAATANPSFHLLDWGDIEFRKPGWLLYDDIHPSKSGSEELAHLEYRAILSCPA